MIDLACQFDSSSELGGQAFEYGLSAAALMYPPARTYLPKLVDEEIIAKATKLGLVVLSPSPLDSERYICVGSTRVPPFATPSTIHGYSGHNPHILLFDADILAGGVNTYFQTDRSSNVITICTRTVTAATTATAVSERPSAIPSKLGERIDAARAVATVEPEAIVTADSAARDAKYLVDRATLGGEPRIMFAEDGILTMQWQRDGYGVVLLFAGDGEASIAFKKPGQLYAQNGIDIKVTGELPGAFHDVLTRILG